MICVLNVLGTFLGSPRKLVSLPEFAISPWFVCGEFSPIAMIT